MLKFPSKIDSMQKCLINTQISYHLRHFLTIWDPFGKSFSKVLMGFIRIMFIGPSPPLMSITCKKKISPKFDQFECVSGVNIET